MDLKDVIDEFGDIQQGSCEKYNRLDNIPTTINIIGFIYYKNNVKYAVARCLVCASDEEVFGEGYFTVYMPSLKKGHLPCGCGKAPKYTENQMRVLCTRAANRLGYEFIDFAQDYSGVNNKILLKCPKHGEWCTGSIRGLLSKGRGCLKCQADLLSLNKRTATETKYENFEDSFCRVLKVDWRDSAPSAGGRARAKLVCQCKTCYNEFETMLSDFMSGCRCPLCSGRYQNVAYVSLVSDGDTDICLKFGITTESNLRDRNRKQNRKTVYEIKQIYIFKFEDYRGCKKAERECLKELKCGVVSKNELPDGYTETTYLYNLDEIIKIYERNGGIQNEC